MSDSENPGSQDPRDEGHRETDSEGVTVGRTLRLTFLTLFIVIGSLALWVWISSGADGNLPFGYAGFD